MGTREKLIQARVSMLALADELQHISRACKVAGISRSHFYEVREAFEKCGWDGLAPQPRRRPRMPNQTPPEIERQILAMKREYPTHSYVKISDQLKLIGVPAAASAVRGVWLRRGLLTRYERLLRLEREPRSAPPRQATLGRGAAPDLRGRALGVSPLRPGAAHRGVQHRAPGDRPHP